MNMQLVFVHAQRELDPCPSLIGTYNSCSYLPKGPLQGARRLVPAPAFSFSLLWLVSHNIRPYCSKVAAIEGIMRYDPDFLFFREVGEWVGGELWIGVFLDNCWAPKHLAGAQELVFLNKWTLCLLSKADLHVMENKLWAQSFTFLSLFTCFLSNIETL